jgi:hypothetical protein
MASMIWPMRRRMGVPPPTEGSMADFIYTNVSGKIEALFAKIRDVGKPPKVTRKWLESAGFKSKNDRTLVPMLKGLGFIDDAGQPTDVWALYRGKQARAAMADAVRSAYPAFFDMYDDAHRRDAAELTDIVMGSSEFSATTAGFVAATFLKLCDLADFAAPQAAGESDPAVGNAPPVEAPTARELSEGASSNVHAGRGLSVNINLQITLPETTNEEVYEKLFAAMKKHILE